MMVDKILFITLSNIGDVILTLPVLDTLRDNFPQSKITVLTGPRPREIFQDNARINKVIVYDKHSRLKEKIKLFKELREENYDMVIDLRNSFFGLFLSGRYNIFPFLSISKNIKHMRDRHLYRLRRITKGCVTLREVRENRALNTNSSDEEFINQVLIQNGIKKEDKIVVISAGARSHIKRWGKERFLELTSLLTKDFGAKVILVGDKGDAHINKYIIENLPPHQLVYSKADFPNWCGGLQYPIVDLTAKTTLRQLASLLKKAGLLITNDSAVLHLGSYFNTPIVAVFGPTDETRYGPWSETSLVVKKDIFCRPCAKAQCKFGTLECMQLIKVEDVLRRVRGILVAGRRSPVAGQREDFKRILIVRTDRIGDVVLSTPVIKAIRDAYPNAYIAMMVSPYAKDIVEGNPYLDGVIIYDKDSKHKSWHRTIKFAHNLKKKRFDLAIILHPTNRVHLVTFLAGIHKRVGYDRKLGFLLTDRIKHIKQLGEKHELEYNLDLIRYLGIEPEEKNTFMPIRPISEKQVEELLQQKGIIESDKILAIHPGASCPSKIWPNDRFAEVADRLIDRYGFKVLFVAAAADLALAQRVVKQMHHPALNLTGKISVSQLASVLKRCQLFISNDSGPVHIASAIGIPVISIFGRNQKGLSPQRWGPLGVKDKILHKEVGCIECLAHNCEKEFACLKAITVDDVLNAADSLLEKIEEK